MLAFFGELLNLKGGLSTAEIVLISLMLVVTISTVIGVLEIDTVRVPASPIALCLTGCISP